MAKFTMNGKNYETDIETLRILADQCENAISTYRSTGTRDTSAVVAMMAAGIATGTITEKPGTGSTQPRTCTTQAG